VSAQAATLKPIWLVFGEDDFAVKERAREIFGGWCAEAGDLDQEIIDASVANSGEALSQLNRLLDAVQSLPFFGGVKLVWFKNCNFLGDDRTASSAAVIDRLSALVQEFKSFPSTGLRLLISAGKADRRRIWFKSLEKIATVENPQGLSASERGWEARAESWVQNKLGQLHKTIVSEALAQFVAWVGPDMRQLNSEAEKLALYAGARQRIELKDVEAVVTRQKQARAFALGDALGDRALARALKALDEELWEMRSGGQKSEIGLLYGLISKVRTLLFLKEMQRHGWIRPESDYARFKAQLERIPSDELPSDKRFNPLASNAFVLFKAFPQLKLYTQAELLHAMDVLLECNYRLVSSDSDEALVLQQALVSIIGTTAATPL
jgi:DNA polymerase III subunit delta